MRKKTIHLLLIIVFVWPGAVVFGALRPLRKLGNVDMAARDFRDYGWINAYAKTWVFTIVNETASKFMSEESMLRYLKLKMRNFVKEIRLSDSWESLGLKAGEHDHNMLSLRLDLFQYNDNLSIYYGLLLWNSTVSIEQPEEKPKDFLLALPIAGSESQLTNQIKRHIDTMVEQFAEDYYYIEDLKAKRDKESKEWEPKTFRRIDPSGPKPSQQPLTVEGPLARSALAGEKTIEEIDVEWKARSLKALEAIGKWTEAAKSEKPIPTYQKQIMCVEFAYGMIIDPNKPVVKRDENVQTYHLLFNYGSAEDSSVHIGYTYNRNTGKYNALNVYKLPDSVDISLPTFPNETDKIVLIDNSKGTENASMLVLNRFKPFDIVYMTEYGMPIRVDGEYDFSEKVLPPIPPGGILLD